MDLLDELPRTHAELISALTALDADEALDDMPNVVDIITDQLIEGFRCNEAVDLLDAGLRALEAEEIVFGAAPWERSSAPASPDLAPAPETWRTGPRAPVVGEYVGWTYQPRDTPPPLHVVTDVVGAELADA